MGRLPRRICNHHAPESVLPGRAAPWPKYLKEHYNEVIAALPGDSFFSYLPQTAAGFDTPERQRDVESFFKDKDVRLTGGPRIIAQTVESIHLNQAFKEAQLPSPIEFLNKQ